MVWIELSSPVWWGVETALNCDLGCDLGFRLNCDLWTGLDWTELYSKLKFILVWTRLCRTGQEWATGSNGIGRKDHGLFRAEQGRDGLDTLISKNIERAGLGYGLFNISWLRLCRVGAEHSRPGLNWTVVAQSFCLKWSLERIVFGTKLRSWKNCGPDWISEISLALPPGLF